MDLVTKMLSNTVYIKIQSGVSIFDCIIFVSITASIHKLSPSIYVFTIHINVFTTFKKDDIKNISSKKSASVY